MKTTYKLSTVLFLLLLITPHNIVSNDTQHVGSAHQPARVENFEGFDDFDSAVEQAIDKGMLTDKPEMRAPYWGEVPLRRVASFLLTQYIALRGSVQAWYNSLRTCAISDQSDSDQNNNNS